MGYAPAHDAVPRLPSPFEEPGNRRKLEELWASAEKGVRTLFHTLGRRFPTG